MAETEADRVLLASLRAATAPLDDPLASPAGAWTRQAVDLAVGITPLETRRDVIVRLAAAAERCGYSAFYVPEGWGYDAGALVAELAVRSGRIQLRTGVLNTWGRTAATLAMLATTLADISGGRFALGLGAGSPALAEGLHDVTYEQPVARLGHVTRQVRRLLDGERQEPASPRAVRPLRLAVQPKERVPIHLAGLGPEAIRLAGELSDAWIPFLLPLSSMPEALGWLQEGAARTAGRPVPQVSPCLPLAIGPDRAQVQRLASWWIGFYLTAMGPLYLQTLRRAGFGDEVDLVLASEPSPGTWVVPSQARGLLDELLLHGSPEEAAAGLQRWARAGAQMPVIVLPPGRPEQELLQAMEALSDAVATVDS